MRTAAFWQQAWDQIQQGSLGEIMWEKKTNPEDRGLFSAIDKSLNLSEVQFIQL